MPTQNPSDRSGDILSPMMGKDPNSEAQMRLLRSIDDKLGQMIQQGRSMSQANAVNTYGGGYSYVNPKYSGTQRNSIYNNSDSFDPSKITEGIASEVAKSIINSRGLKGMFDSVIKSITGPITLSVRNTVFDLLDGIEHSVKIQVDKAIKDQSSSKSIFELSGLSKKLKTLFGSMADDLGVDVKDLKKGLGRELGKKLINSTDLKFITDFWNQYSHDVVNDMKGIYDEAAKANDVGNRDEVDAYIKDQQAIVAKSDERLGHLNQAAMELSVLRKKLAERQGKEPIDEEDWLSDMIGDYGSDDIRHEQSEVNREIYRKKMMALNGESDIDFDESEASASTKARKGKNQGSSEGTESQSGRKTDSIENLTATAQSCAITTKNADIIIDGINIDELLGIRNKSETTASVGSVESETTASVGSVERLESGSEQLHDRIVGFETALSEYLAESFKNNTQIADEKIFDLLHDNGLMNSPEITNIIQQMVADAKQQAFQQSIAVAHQQSKQKEGTFDNEIRSTLLELSNGVQGLGGLEDDLKQFRSYSDLSKEEVSLLQKKGNQELNEDETEKLQKIETSLLSQKSMLDILRKHGVNVTGTDEFSTDDLTSVIEFIRDRKEMTKGAKSDAIQNLQDISEQRAQNALTGASNLTVYLDSVFGKLFKSNKLTSKLYEGYLDQSEKGSESISNRFSELYNAGKKKYRGDLGKAINEDGTFNAEEFANLDPKKMSGVNGIISTLTGESVQAGEAMAGLTNVVSALGPEALLAGAAFKLVTGMIKGGLQPAIEGFKKTMSAADAAMNRYHLTQKKNIENAQKRLLEDINTLVSTPFDILKKGAEEWYSAWDNNLRTITATQGYTKSDLQDLMATFADRLRRENLTSVVAATDITNNLRKVLESGLSGTIAEEFAYIATKLNAAVPTQDFFSYADTYASIAANAVRLGMGQTEAIEYANKQLTSFANNVLYASREVAGGFTTGLKNAEALFKQSVQIAQAGKTNNASEISGVLTAVSAITGSIAPDLASAMTDAIYKASVGGNSTEIVALRSLAGINASNTEFLRQVSESPKKVFADLFRELSVRQNMSNDAYMEVADELSKIFGLSADSFARVDFAYLAQAIESMDTSSKALSDNMLLLQSGETTTNAEQMKMQQINKMILDEGLSYVLDNEAARAIQEHMWNEQLARELQETEYGVNLHGAALELLEGIRHAVDTITTLLNPVKLIGKIANLFTSSKEEEALQADIGTVLDLGKVGQGNALARYQLVTSREDLNVTDDLASMLGGTSSYRKWNNITKDISASPMGDFGNFGTSNLPEADVIESTIPTSKYRWESVGKSIAEGIFSTSQSNYNLSGIEGIRNENSEKSTSSSEMIEASKNMQKMLNSMENYVNNNQSASYEDWVKTARQYGIANYEENVKGSGLSESQIANQFALYQAQIGEKQKKERERKEEGYWENTEEYMKTTSESSVSNAALMKFLSDTIDTYSEPIMKFANSTESIQNILNGDQFKGMLKSLSMSGSSLSNLGSAFDTINGSINSVSNAISSMTDSSDSSDKNITDLLDSIDKTLYDSIYATDYQRQEASGDIYSVSQWLRMIHMLLDDNLRPDVNYIAKSFGKENGNNSSDTDRMNTINEHLAAIIKALSGNENQSVVEGTRFVNGTLQQTWMSPMYSSMTGLATGGTGY